MKKILLAFVTFLSLSPALIKAQTFTTVADTVKATVTGTETIHNDIIIPASVGSQNVNWTVTSTNFPADWLTNAALGICDGTMCRNNLHDTLLWRTTAATPGNTFSCTYTTAGPNPFYYSPNLTSVTSNGCYYMTISMSDGVPLGTSKTITYIICRGATGVPSIKNAEDKVMLYPNPASNEVNIVYDINADVKNIAVYNIIGKMMSVYKVTGNSANLNIENIPSGIYFMKLYNSNGNVVVTRKFTKQ